MNHSLSTAVIIKAKDLGFTLDEVENQRTGMYQVVITKTGQSMPLFSVFLMSGGLYHWDQNVTLPPFLVHRMANRFKGDQEFIEMLAMLAIDLITYEA